MKNKSFLIVLLIACSFCVSCNTSNQPEDTTRFSTKSIVGTWVAIDSANYDVLYYYDIKDDSHLLYVDQICTNGDAKYSPSDCCMHTTKGKTWTPSGDLIYVFDEDNQVLRCTDGTLWGFDVSFIVGLLGSDEIFDVKRIGLDEAYIYDKTDWLLDAHIYRIKGVKDDLQQ